MELEPKTYEKLKKIILGRIRKLRIIDEEEALSEMNLVIANACKNFDPCKMKGPHALEKYIIICVRRRLINFAKKSTFVNKKNIDIETIKNTFEDKFTDPELVTKFNTAVEKTNQMLTPKQKKIFKLLLSGLTINEIAQKVGFCSNKTALSKEKNYIIEVLKRNL